MQVEAPPATPPSAPPRELARQTAASALPAELRQPLHDWLLALERLRYAPSPQADGLATLEREFRRFRWPRAT